MGLCIQATLPEAQPGLPSFTIPYSRFAHLCEALAPMVDAKYFYERHYTEKDGLALAGKPDLNSYTFRYPSEWNNNPLGNSLLIFFMHSDCDGEIAAMDLQHLATAFEQHHVAQQVDQLPAGRVKADSQRFLKFLQKSVNDNADWKFY